MTAYRTIALMACASISATMAAESAWAVNLLAGREGLPQKYVERLMEGMKGLEKMDSSDEAKGLFSKLVVWPPSYAKLRVCFMGGSDQVNSAVAKTASMWNVVADLSLKLDFGKMDKPRRCDPNGRESQIRVSYDQPGYWSQLGQNSVVYTAQEEASLNLEGFDKASNPNQLMAGEFKGVILHEFGHALGLLHEHQSPVATCANEFNWDFIVKYLSGPPNSWNEDTIRFNLAPYSGEDLMMTDFDPSSIMLYSFPAEYYLKGANSTCFIGRSNTDISPADKATVEYMYSADVASRVKNFEQSKAQFAEMMKKAEDAGTKSVTMNYVEAYFGAKGVAADEE